MQKTHRYDAERPFVDLASEPHYARRTKTKANRDIHTLFSWLGGVMTTRKDLGRRLARSTLGTLPRPRELFGESLPELLLLTAVVAAVVSAIVALSGAG
jgi:hypothetical protein